MYTIEYYKQNQKDDWDQLVKQADPFHFFFYIDYLNHQSYKFIDLSLVCRYNNEVVSIFPLSKENSQVISHSGLSFCEPIFKNRLSNIIRLEILEAYIKFLQAEGYKSLYIKIIPNIYKEYEDSLLLYWITINNGTSTKIEIGNYVSIKNISPTKRRKRSFKNAIKNRLETLELNKFEDEDWKLVKDGLKNRHNATPVHTLEEINYLKERFNKQIELYRVFSIKELLGIMVIYKTKKIFHIQYSVSSELGLKLNAMDFRGYPAKRFLKTSDHFTKNPQFVG